MNFLADRRILRVGRSRPQVEAEKFLRSAHECRARLSELLDRLDEPGSDLNTWLAAIRHGFNEFIEECERQNGGNFGPGSEVKFNEALAQLRTRVRHQTAQVSKRDNLDVLVTPTHPGWPAD
ncbi:hypothetical protein [Streptomyces sp. NPDC059893]|uniref:hypothetical protein n=1 Tax=Streptomyces sp. NPDC059893 TaxID=3346990 RepID=UPI00364890A8